MIHYSKCEIAGNLPVLRVLHCLAPCVGFKNKVQTLQSNHQSIKCFYSLQANLLKSCV